MKSAKRKSPSGKHPEITHARRVAFEILNRVASENAYASVLLASLNQLSREDQALTQELVLGVLRQQKTLDYFIKKYAGRKIAKLDLAVLLALRLGLYQLRFLTRIPPSAAVNESVKLVKFARKSSAAPFVNATLRNAARHLEDQPGEGINDALEKLAIAVSHPRWMLERWIKTFGETEATELARANNQTPLLAFRVNTLKAQVDEVLDELTKAGVQIAPSKIARQAFVVEQGSIASLTRALEAGRIYIQDEASQLIARLLDVKPAQRILDMCAAPGSKTSLLAALTDNQAEILAADLYSHRLKTLMTTCNRLGVTSVDAVACDATLGLPFVESAKSFDRVLLDAPCSGTGTLRRNPEIKWRLVVNDLKRLATLQAILLDRAASVVAAGGKLVYSTCSIERQENEAVVQNFLQMNSGFRLLAPNAPDVCITREGFVRTFPHLHATDGFFAAVMERIN
ncbi:MAG: 16S rRNA (cytosine(967)-C(5))-methyltransferase RsmB [Acidobacteriota bacterium]